MTAKTRTKRKHQSRCEGCRRRFASMSMDGGTFCPKCLEAAGHGDVYGRGIGALEGFSGADRKAFGLSPGAALAPAHRRHVRRHRPGVREAGR